MTGATYPKQACAHKSPATPAPRDAEIVAYLWENVERRGADECWNWTRSANIKGRGYVSFRGFRMLAPRVAFFAGNGRWPDADLCVCHSCDNPACCNPAHLWLGTQKDNMIDMQRKGRTNPKLSLGRGWQRSLTHCKRGHPLSGDNLTRNNGGGRKCLACVRIHCATWRAKKKGERHV